MEDVFKTIDKFMYFTWNYKMVSVNVNSTKEIVPVFIVKVNWTFGLDHAVMKWKAASSGFESMSYVPNFYMSLDTDNRELFVNWVMKNYK